MAPFLDQVAAVCLREYMSAPGGCTLIFPNRRSAVFFRRYLGLRAKGPVFAPRTLTISDLFAELSGLRPSDKVGMLYRLYLRYAALMWPGAEPAESFDEFVYWGDILLSDFDDIDKYRVDAQKLFTNVRDLNEIDFGFEFQSENQRQAVREFWEHFLAGGEPALEEDKKHLFRTTWKILYDLYARFRDELLAGGECYEGGICRQVTDALVARGEAAEALIHRLRGYGQLVFVGLNALNSCERLLMNVARDRLDADFYWDYEDERLRDKNNKSSLFINDNIRDYPSRFRLAPSLPSRQEFRVVAVPSAVAQTRVVSHILSDMAAGEDFDPFTTAIVLPDENLLLPMIDAVPERIESINVTMGYPLSASGAASLLRLLEAMHRRRRDTAEGPAFYHRDVVHLLNHPLFASAESEAAQIRAQIIEKNIIYCPASLLAERGGLFAAVFRPADDENLSQYLHEVVAAAAESAAPIDREFLGHIDRIISRIEGFGIKMKLKTRFRLLMQLMQTVRIPFEGEPLSGLQIMGPLETRCLDFKHIFMLSVSEGTFPRQSVSGSFIPYNLRLAFGLPTYELRDAVAAYHFYRSISRAERITLLYDSRTGGLQSGEPSRFIKQLKYHFEVPLKEEEVSFPIIESPSEEPSKVDKDARVMEFLIGHFLEDRKALSPSALNSYINCPLVFYYKYVMGLGEEEDVSETVDSRLFGTVFHYVMESIYRPLCGHQVTAAMIERIRGDRQRLEQAVRSAFASDSVRIREVSGRNIIIMELVLHYVDKVLAHDMQVAPFTVVGTEVHLSCDFEFDEGCSVHLYGVADRIDRPQFTVNDGVREDNGITRIIDYKSGKTKDKSKVNKSISEMFDPDNKDRPSIALQLAFYSLLYGRKYPSVKSGAYIYGLQEKDELEISLPPQFCDIDEFGGHLAELIREIFNPDIPFMARESRRCEYCDFRHLCKER